MELDKANQVKNSLTLSDPFVVPVFGDNVRNVIGDSFDLMFCNLYEARSFTNTHSTEVAVEQLKNI